MPSADKRIMIFMDGQNIYHLAKKAWAPVPPDGWSPYSFPSYDVEKLAKELVLRQSQCVLSGIRFYTGVPDASYSDFWHDFWTNKLRYLASRRIELYRGRINPNGQEKGVDVSLAIDLIKLTYEQAYDTAIIVSQDQDFGPAVKLAKEIAHGQGRMVQFISAFPFEETRINPATGRNVTNRRGIPGCAWVHITKTMYDACYDSREYRSNPPPRL